jgi:hypothetical protein
MGRWESKLSRKDKIREKTALKAKYIVIRSGVSNVRA